MPLHHSFSHNGQASWKKQFPYDLHLLMYLGVGRSTPGKGKCMRAGLEKGLYSLFENLKFNMARMHISGQKLWEKEGEMCGYSLSSLYPIPHFCLQRITEIFFYKMIFSHFVLNPLGKNEKKCYRISLHCDLETIKGVTLRMRQVLSGITKKQNWIPMKSLDFTVV